MAAHLGLWDEQLAAEVDAVTQACGTTKSQLIRAALVHTLPLIRAGAVTVPGPRRVGRRPRTSATEVGR